MTEVARTLTSPARASGAAAIPQLPKPPTGLMAALTTLGMAYRYNLRGQRSEVREEADHDWTALHDRWEADLRARIVDAFDQQQNGNGEPKPLHVGRVAWPEAFNALLCPAEVDHSEVEPLTQLSKASIYRQMRATDSPGRRRPPAAARAGQPAASRTRSVRSGEAPARRRPKAA